jgi:hypothetical protein
LEQHTTDIHVGRQKVYLDVILLGIGNSSNIQLKNDINLETLADILDPLLN